MAPVGAVWYNRHQDAWVPHDMKHNLEIEAAFCKFWQSDTASPIFEFHYGDQDAGRKCCINFCTFEQNITIDEKCRQRSIVCRKEAGANAQDSHTLRIQWGHGQDSHEGVAFAPFDAATNSLLEAGFATFKAGVGLTGVAFTASNRCDYLVDYSQMRQTRIVTRRARPVYRHAIAGNFRMGVDPDVAAGPDTIALCKREDLPATEIGRLLSGIPRPFGSCGDSKVFRPDVKSKQLIHNSNVSMYEEPQQSDSYLPVAAIKKARCTFQSQIMVRGLTCMAGLVSLWSSPQPR
jgi:hypothetical protein